MVFPPCTACNLKITVNSSGEIVVTPVKSNKTISATDFGGTAIDAEFAQLNVFAGFFPDNEDILKSLKVAGFGVSLAYSAAVNGTTAYKNIQSGRQTLAQGITAGSLKTAISVGFGLGSASLSEIVIAGALGVATSEVTVPAAIIGFAAITIYNYTGSNNVNNGIDVLSNYLIR